MKAVVLTYHSHHVQSANYAENDHLALPADISTVTAAGRPQPELAATSFVIASPVARKVAESTFDLQYTHVVPGALDDAGWIRAVESDLLAIANLSWDALSPAPPRVAHSADVD